METFCKDCRLNPEAKKPYAKMMRVRVTRLTGQLLDKLAKKEKTKVECLVCKALTRLFKSQEK